MTSLRDNLIKAAQVRLVKEAEARQESVAAAGELLIYAFKKAASNPLLVKRANDELDPETQADLDAGEKRWSPNIFPSYADKPSGMMASPLKQGLLWAAPGGVLGAGAGAFVGDQIGKFMGGSAPQRNTTMQYGTSTSGIGGLYGASIGGLAGAGLSGFMGAKSQHASNDTTKQLVGMLPKGVRRGDIEQLELRNILGLLDGLAPGEDAASAKGKPRTKRAAEGAAPIPMAPAGSHNIAMSKAGPVRGLMNMKRPLGGGSQAGGPSYGKAAIKNLPR
jgi:hypothetical protein